MGPLWGIDLGGTKIEGVILESRENPRVLQRTRIATEAHIGYWHIVNRIAQVIEVMTTQTGIKPSIIGMGTPGVIDANYGTMKNCNTTVLNGRTLKEDIESILNIPFKFANDANCFALAETTMGAVKTAVPDAKVVFGIIMGTGVGGGIIVNKTCLNGKHGIAGEWGHNILDESGGDCYCGKVGCVERILSGPALERYYKSLTNKDKKLKDIVWLHYEGRDDAATATIQRLIKYFGKAVAYLVNILDPDAIVLGGGLSNIDLLYTEGVEEVKKYVFNHEMNTKFLKPELGDSAGVFGAALL